MEVDEAHDYSLLAEPTTGTGSRFRFGSAFLSMVLIWTLLAAERSHGHVARAQSAKHSRSTAPRQAPSALAFAETQASSCRRNGFPSDFVWGLGTAAYQIEGGANETGRQPSIWDHFSHMPGKVQAGDTGDIACDHLHRFREDVALMKSIGLKHYRFSISWSRVMFYDAASRRMVANEAGLLWYDQLLTALEEAGITPYVTLYHWDLPLAVHSELGGWHTPHNAAVVAEFARYAEVCFTRWGGRVQFWVTFNEPWSFVVEGYDSGKSAPGCVPFQPGPGRCANGAVDVYVVAHNVSLPRVDAD
jgi:beta-glucosidase